MLLLLLLKQHTEPFSKYTVNSNYIYISLKSTFHFCLVCSPLYWAYSETLSYNQPKTSTVPAESKVIKQETKGVTYMSRLFAFVNSDHRRITRKRNGKKVCLRKALQTFFFLCVLNCMGLILISWWRYTISCTIRYTNQTRFVSRHTPSF